MLSASFGFQGGISAPNKIAALAGYDILKDGGTAIEAMVAAAATISVTYPHMNGIGGDAFWLIQKKGEEPVCISGGGHSAVKASVDWYKDRGIVQEIPTRGGLSCLIVPGAVASWEKALSLVDNPMPISDLFTSAILYAKLGFPVTENQHKCTLGKLSELNGTKEFSNIFLENLVPPKPGTIMKQKALQSTFESLCANGLKSFYEGDIAKIHADFLYQNGSPLLFKDFKEFRAEFLQPLKADISKGRLYNLPAPTQGISSLMILALFDKLNVRRVDSFEHIHGLIEIAKRTFLQRNSELGDPKYMLCSVQSWLNEANLLKMLGDIDFSMAMPWPHNPNPGDTIWMGAIDSAGTSVSFIQSLFWEFGSGLLCPETGVIFQNRGAGFSLYKGPNQLMPRKKPFHTLNPALALFKNGRRMVYGTMGGDGQPQTQSAIFTRYAYFDQDLQRAISSPRWLLGKTWGDTGTSLKVESRLDPSLIKKLFAAGHEVEELNEYSDLVGHAGALVLHSGGLIEGAADPRSDGAALVF